MNSKIDRCPITNDSNQIMYFDLGEIPLANNLCDTYEESISADRFPLNINYYQLSGISSLNFAVDGELLFKNYLFKSGVSTPYYNHCKEMFIYAQNYINIKNGTKIADIGGNDGTLLLSFKDSTNKELELLNIDPSKNLSDICLKNGIPVYNDFFSLETSFKINKKFEVITSTNVFQHLKDINSFCEGILNILSDSGIWILEFPYWIHDMETNQFDQIYHEHMYYHSIKPLVLMMKKHKLKIINITNQKIHGGTLRLIICREESNLTEDTTIQDYLTKEEKYNLEYHINWGKNIKNHIDLSKNFIKNIKEEGKKIFGFGAAAKGCIYLNAMGLNNSDIDFIIDDTDVKQGKFVPGTGIEIISRDILNTNKPDYILILAHNFTEHIIKSLEKLYDGRYIVLIPNPIII